MHAEIMLALVLLKMFLWIFKVFRVFGVGSSEFLKKCECMLVIKYVNTALAGSD